MTTVYERLHGVDPGTHWLAIGVGKYPHLIGGDQALAKITLGLSQLTSPPVSTKVIIDWCLARLLNSAAPGLVNPSCPLASVEALVSSEVPVEITTPSGPQVLEPATRANIKAAFSRWLQRVKSNDDNIGMFYFCGHGFMISDQYLLAEDFGSDDDLPWGEAFDLSNTLRAVEREVKGALYFLVDACREVSRELALTLGASPQALKAVDLKKPVTCVSKSLIQATGEGRLAFAPEGGVSQFTAALLMALSGYCGTRGPGSATWDVDGETLASAVRKFLGKSDTTQERRQVSDQFISGVSVPVLRLSSVPRVKVELDLLPEKMRNLAKLYLLSIGGDNFEHDGQRGVFRIEVPRGFYSVGARPAASQFREVIHQNEEVSPPFYSLVLEVGR